MSWNNLAVLPGSLVEHEENTKEITNMKILDELDLVAELIKLALNLNNISVKELEDKLNQVNDNWKYIYSLERTNDYAWLRWNYDTSYHWVVVNLVNNETGQKEKVCISFKLHIVDQEPQAYIQNDWEYEHIPKWSRITKVLAPVHNNVYLWNKDWRSARHTWAD